MPRRTNEFQQLIYAIQCHLDPGSTVVESALLVDILTGAKREVDIVVSGRVGDQPVTVSIECRDRARPADVTWVDEMQAKHSRLQTNVLVLVSHSAFTSEAQRVAHRYSIRCLALTETDPMDPGRLFPDVSSLWGKGSQLNIDRIEAWLSPTDMLSGGFFNPASDTLLFLSPEAPCGTCSEYSIELLKSPIVGEKMHQEATPEHNYVELIVEPPRIGNRVLSVRHEASSLIQPLERMRIVARCVVTVDEFPLRHGMYGDLRIAWGRGVILGKPTLLLATEDLGSSTKVTIRMQANGEGIG